jgi:hypothetical protein
VKSSTLWRCFVVLSLHSPIHSAADPVFTQFVDSIGEDTTHTTTSLDLFETVTDEEEAIQFLYPPEIMKDPFTCLQQVFLSPHNCFVDEFNERMLMLLSGNECKYSIQLPVTVKFTFMCKDCFLSADHISKNGDEAVNVDIDYIIQQTHNGIPPHALYIKRDSICALLRNMNVEIGLVKNTRVIVHEIH